MIEINLLEQLTAFADYGTLTNAAEHLHTSQPALTRAMKKLEDELGISIFIRSKNHLSLNDVGQKAAEYARTVLEADKDFETKIRAYSRSLQTISIGYCAPVVQSVLTPIINNLFNDMTISADMSDDSHFIERVKNHEYHLAVLHQKPDDAMLFSKKIGHEDLFISLMPGDPLSFYPEVHLSDLNGKSVVLFSRIGFWSEIQQTKTPYINYLLQVEQSAFEELALNSSYPSFSSSYYINRGEVTPGKVHVPLSDSECHADYYLVCLKQEKEKYTRLFNHLKEDTIK